MNKLRFGIIGMSAGNGHPYSWSAIFNGFKENVMKECPFPMIPQYLYRYCSPNGAINEANVTHIWTQERALSEHIAEAAKIECVVDNFSEMIGCVDGVIIARDDYEHHYEFSKPFLEVGLPVFIDKPLAGTVEEAKRIYALEKYDGQIFSCSCLRYAKEFQVDSVTRSEIGELEFIEAHVIKDWAKYGVHVIEPTLLLAGDQGEIKGIKAYSKEEKKVVIVSWSSGMQMVFVSLGNAKGPISIRLVGDNGYKDLIFNNTFYAFKKALESFVGIVKNPQPLIKRDFVMRVMQILEEGGL